MAALTITSAVYQDATLELSWFGTGSGPATQMAITLTNGAGVVRNFTATGFTASISTDLDQDTSWTATVAPSTGGAASPSVPLFVVAPTVTLVQNTGGGLDAAWQALSGVTTFSTTLAQLGVTSTTHQVQGLSDTFAGGLTGDGWSFTVRASSADGVSQGPGTSYVPILAAPTLTMVSYSGTALMLAWAPVTGFSAYSAWLQAGANPPQRQTVSQGLMATFAGALAQGAHTTWVSVQSADGVCIGPPSQVYAPIQVSPVMTSVNYNGATLSLVWTAAPGFAVTLASVQALGHQARQQSIRGTSCSFSGPLTGVGDNSCVVRAQSEDGVNTGPAADVFTIIVGNPILQELDYDAAALTLQWTAATDPTVTGNLLVLSGGAQPINVPLGTTGSQSVPATLAAGGAYGAVLYATNGIVVGPGSPPVIPLTVAPTGMVLGFDGAHLRANWAAVAGSGVTGYIAELSKDGVATETDPAATPRQVFTSGLTADSIFTARARATGANAKGPWSAPATGPYRTTMTYGFDGQGRIKTVGWSNGAAETYGFDTAGNLLTFVRTAPLPGAEGS
jgi:hypothetical protein